jgi:hypothetical protein
MKQYIPNGDVAHGNHVLACTSAHAVFARLRPVLKPCSDAFTRAHLLKQAAGRLAHLGGATWRLSGDTPSNESDS